MTTLEQQIDSESGKVLSQVLHRNGKSRFMYKVNGYDAMMKRAMAVYDDVKFITRHGKRVCVYTSYFTIAN